MAWITYAVKTPEGWKESRDHRSAAAMAREAHKRDREMPDRPRAKVGWRDPDGRKRGVTVDPDHADDFLKRASLAEEKGEDWDGALVSGPPPAPLLAEALLSYVEYEKDRGIKPVTLRKIDSLMNVLIRSVKANDPRDREGRPAVDAAGEPTVRALHDRSVPVALRSLDDHTATGGHRRAVFMRWWQYMSAMEPYSEHTRANAFAAPMRRVAVSEARPAPTWEHADAVIAYLREAGDHRIADQLTIARYAGLRISEVYTLEWADVDLGEGLLTVRAEKTKTGRGRVVPMSPHLTSFLRGIYTGGTGRIVGGCRDSKVNAKILAAWRTTEADPDSYEARKDANGKDGHARANHTFRAVVMQGLRDAGVADGVRKHIVGHRAGTTEDAHYSAPPMPDQRAAVEKIPAVDPRAARKVAATGTDGANVVAFRGR